MGKYYVVIQGRAWGVYDDWYVLETTGIIKFTLKLLFRLEVKPLVTGIDGIFKTYPTYEKAWGAFDRCREQGRLKILE